jgi:hypothetical protein
MSDFQIYKRVGCIEARPWTKREADTYHLSNNSGGVSVSRADFSHAISKDAVGYVARNPDNHADQWYIAPAYFAKHYAENEPNPRDATIAAQSAEIERLRAALARHVNAHAALGKICEMDDGPEVFEYDFSASMWHWRLPEDQAGSAYGTDGTRLTTADDFCEAVEALYAALAAPTTSQKKE